MSRNVEYRVRAVTRYVVTVHDDTSTQEVGEFKALELASGAAAALALAERENGGGAVFIPYEGPPPGKVMRCKVFLSSRMANVTWATGADGKPLGRTITQGDGDRAYKSPDPQDPANWRPDGENLGFYAVCAGFDQDGVPNVEENRIFGYWSPNVEMKMTVRNQAVLEALEQGREYYVDFTPALKS